MTRMSDTSVDFHMPDSFYDPPEPHDCDDPDCDGTACLDKAQDAYEQHLIDQEEARRDEEEDWNDRHDTH